MVKRLKVGDRVVIRMPALGDRDMTVEVRTIATRGEYAGWRATRATGDFDLRTFEVRAYPVSGALCTAIASGNQRMPLLAQTGIDHQIVRVPEVLNPHSIGIKPNLVLIIEQY